MADDIGGLLNNFDPKQLQALLAQFNPSDEDKKAAMMRQLTATGLALMGAKKGQEWGAVGNAGLLGLQAKDQYLQEQRQARMGNMVSAGGLLNLKDRMQAEQDAAKARAVLGAFRMPVAIPPPGSMPSASFTPEVNATKTVPKPSSTYETLNAKADALDAAGLSTQADVYRKSAQTYAPKYKGTETVIDPATGKAVLLQQYENQAPEPMKYQPTPKFREVNTGSNVNLVNEYNVPTTGASYPNTMTASQQEASRVANAHLKLAQDKANQEKGEQFGTPIQITAADGSTQLMIPKKGTNQLVPMTDSAGAPVTKSASIPQAYKDKANVLANLRDNLTEYDNAIKDLTPVAMMSPKKVAEVKAKYGAVQMGLKGLFELGVIAGPDMEIISQNLTDPATMKGLTHLQTGGLNVQNEVIYTMLDNADKNLAQSYNQRPKHAPKTDYSGMSDDQIMRAL